MASDLSTMWHSPSRAPASATPRRAGLQSLGFALLCLLLTALFVLPFLQAYDLIGKTSLVTLTTILAGLGLASTGIIGWNCRQHRKLAGRLARQAEQEMEFIELTRHLLATNDRAEAVEWIATGTLALAPVVGTYVEMIRADGTEVEVVAAAGEGAPQPGSRTPYLGSPTERSAEERYPIYLSIADRADSRQPRTTSRPTPNWILAAPLLRGVEPIGALVLVPPPTRSSQPPPLALDRVQIVAEFAALALKRMRLVEEAESRRRELERLLEGKARFIRGLTHDLKNPIGAIDGYAQILEGGVKGELAPAHRDYVARIRTATGSMIRLLDDLSQLARAEAGELRIHTGPTDPTALVHSIIDQYRPKATEKGLRIECATPHPLPEIDIDSERVRQVVGNLLSNAIKYTPAPGTIIIRTEIAEPGVEIRPKPPGHHSGPWLAIAVSDSGPGIAPAQQERIFEEFERLHPEQGEGTGLGLAISRYLARAMGGEITVDSRLSHGATFTLWLPVT